jgi:3',5'-cyclic AMP phosphodiesterase CpdA
VILAQLSDPHIHVGPGDRGSAEALVAAVRALGAVRPVPDALLLSGDLTDQGTDAEYRRVVELLAPLTMPRHVLAGNHDDPEGLRTHLGAPGQPGEPVQYALRLGGIRLVACDTTVPELVEGAYGADRLGWLERRLAEDTATPTIVAMHHPPILSGVPAMDALGLPEADRAAIAALLARTPQVERVVTGHVHRAITGACGGRPVFICPSSHLQLALDLTSEDITMLPQRAFFALHVATADGLASHLEPIGD